MLPRAPAAPSRSWSGLAGRRLPRTGLLFASAWKATLVLLSEVFLAPSVRAASPPPGPVLPTNAAVATALAITNRPGFLWSIHQAAPPTLPDLLSRAEDQLAGRLGTNLANPNAVGPALGRGTAGNSPVDPITFAVESVVNFEPGGASTGAIGGDQPFPGLPGIAGGTDNVAGEVRAWLQLTAGVTYRFVVNSDDGFHLWLGGMTPDDRLAVPVGEFNGARGAADTDAVFTVAQSGLYAARLLWEQGGGPTSLEFYQRFGPTNVLVNDRAHGGAPAYREISGPTRAYATLAQPAPGETDVPFNRGIVAELADGTGPNLVNPASVQLLVDGSPMAASVTKTSDRTRITSTAAIRFASGSEHQVTLRYQAGTAYQRDWSFRVTDYPNLTPDLRSEPARSLPGFIWTVFQNAADTRNTIARAEAALAGELFNGDFPLPNLADPQAIGAAIDPGSVTRLGPGAPLRFEIPDVLNLNQTAGGADGDFTPDAGMPGIPGRAGSGDPTDGIAAEIRTWVSLPAGIVTLGINSDDGFELTALCLTNAARNVVLGRFDAGRGAADSLMTFVVQQAGTYPLRLVWFEGFGGASIEFFSVGADGKKTLLNDVAAGGYPTYRAVSRPGHVTLAARKGYSLLSAPIRAGNNSLNELLPGLPEGATVYTFDSARQRYVSSVSFLNLGWVPNTRIPPGTGFFLHSGQSNNLVVRGEEVSPPVTVPLVGGPRFSLIASPTRRSGLLNGPLEFPVAEGDGIYRWNGTQFTFSSYDFGAWDSPPVLAEGEAFFFHAQITTPRTWLQTGNPGALAATASALSGTGPLRLAQPFPSRRPATGVQGWIQFCNTWPDTAGRATHYTSVPVGPPLNAAGVGDDYQANLWFGPADGALVEAAREGLPTRLLERGLFQGGTLLVTDPTATRLQARIRAWPVTHPTFADAANDGEVHVFESAPFPLDPSIDLNAPHPLSDLASFAVKPRLRIEALPANVPFGFPPLQLQASSIGGPADLPLSFEVARPAAGAPAGIIHVEGNRSFLELTDVGTVRVIAVQAADVIGNYLPARASREVTVRPAAQTIHLPVPAEINLGSAHPGIEAVSPAVLVLPHNAANADVPGVDGLPLQISVAPLGKVVIVTTSGAHQLGFSAEGDYTITARQPGDRRHAAAPEVSRAIRVVRLALEPFFDAAHPEFRAVRLQAAIGSQVRVEWSADPSHDPWHPLAEVPVAASLTTLLDPSGTGSTRYYRAVGH